MLFEIIFSIMYNKINFKKAFKYSCFAAEPLRIANSVFGT